MKKLALALTFATVATIAIFQLALPVKAFTCSQVNYNDCDHLCHQYAPGNCVVIATTCNSIGGDITCGCDLICTYVSYDPYSGGHKHMAIVENEN